MGVLTTLRDRVREVTRDWQDFNRTIGETPERLDQIGTGGGRRPQDRQTGAASFTFPPGTVLAPDGRVLVGSGGGGGGGVRTTSSPVSGGVRTTSDAPVDAAATQLIRPVGNTGPAYSAEFLQAVGSPGTFALPSGSTLEGWYLNGSFYPAPRSFGLVSSGGSGGGGSAGGAGRSRPRGVRGPQALDRGRDYIGPDGRVIREGDSGGGRATASSTVAVDRMRVDLGSKIDQLTAAVKQRGSLGDILRRQA